jgi:AbrB family looped-hinge helix DNA binding protein
LRQIKGYNRQESGFPEINFLEKIMQLVKLGKKGQVSLPKAILQQVGITGETPLLVDATDDGAIVLRRAGVYPIEIYSDERITSFLAEDTMTPEQTAKLNKALKK